MYLSAYIHQIAIINYDSFGFNFKFLHSVFLSFYLSILCPPKIIRKFVKFAHSIALYQAEISILIQCVYLIDF